MTKDNNASTKKDKQQVSDEHKQAMITLWGMAEHRFSIVFNKQHFTLLWYVNNDDCSLDHLFKCKFVFDKKKNNKSAIIRSSLQFYGIV